MAWPRNQKNWGDLANVATFVESDTGCFGGITEYACRDSKGIYSKVAGEAIELKVVRSGCKVARLRTQDEHNEDGKSWKNFR